MPSVLSTIERAIGHDEGLPRSGGGSTSGSTGETGRTAIARRAARAERAFRWGVGAMAGAIVVMTALVLAELVNGARPALSTFGIGFLSGRTWNPVTEIYGALPFIMGTLETSAVALVLAVPVALGTAILLAEYAPSWLSEALGFLVELLAAIPSIVYGLWGLFTVAPFMQAHVDPLIAASPLGLLPIFGKPLLGLSLLSAGTVLAIMILPIVASVSREVLLAVPSEQREAGVALGLTRWETVRHVLLPYGRAGLLSAVILGLARALGETMAVTMLVGNTPTVTLDLFQPGYSMAAVIANEFTEATSSLHVSALIAIGLVLFVITLIVNTVARLLVRGLLHQGTA